VSLPSADAYGSGIHGVDGVSVDVSRRDYECRGQRARISYRSRSEYAVPFLRSDSRTAIFQRVFSNSSAYLQVVSAFFQIRSKYITNGSLYCEFASTQYGNICLCSEAVRGSTQGVPGVPRDGAAPSSSFRSSFRGTYFCSWARSIPAFSPMG